MFLNVFLNPREWRLRKEKNGKEDMARAWGTPQVIKT